MSLRGHLVGRRTPGAHVRARRGQDLLKARRWPLVPLRGGNGSVSGGSEQGVGFKESEGPAAMLVDKKVVTPLQAYQDGNLSFGFSAGGLLFSYYVGIIEQLQEMSIVTHDTPLAGASAGSLIAVIAKAGLPMSDIKTATLELARDCREGGTRFRLKQVLEGFLRELLPSDIHERCAGRSHLAVTKVFPGLYPELVSQFKDRDDCIATMLTSCHIPWYFDGTPTTRYRGFPHTDGGISNFLPVVPGTATVRVSCLPSKQLVSIPNIHLSPDNFRPWPHNLQQMLAWALEPADQDTLDWLHQQGREDAATWADASGVAAAAAVAAGRGGSTRAALLTSGSSTTAATGAREQQQQQGGAVILPLVVAPPAVATRPNLLMSLLARTSSDRSSSSSSREGSETPSPTASMVYLESLEDEETANTSSSSGIGNGNGSSSGNGELDLALKQFVRPSGERLTLGESAIPRSNSSSSSGEASRGGGWGLLPEILQQLQKRMGRN